MRKVKVVTLHRRIQFMSDPIKHECGVAFIRLLKPLAHFQEKYGTPLYGIRKLQFLMAKQLNRGQDGAGIGVIKLNPEYGNRYIARKRSVANSAVADIFSSIQEDWNALSEADRNDMDVLKRDFPWAGELLLGHLRYGTHGGNSIENIHPFLRQNNWMCRNLVMAGNYNLTNVDELFNKLIELGQQPKEKSDNVTMLEKIGHFLDEENQRIFDQYNLKGFSNLEITEKIKAEMSVERVLKRAFRDLDGGYNMAGMVGHGDAFVIRDPSGIRPSFWYANDELIVMASERAAIMTAFDVAANAVQELGPGNALIVRHTGDYEEVNILPALEKKSCTFERIYFSRGNDPDIYSERKLLGKLLSRIVLKRINYELKHTVFSYVPNTAATSFYGLIDGVNEYVRDYQYYAIRRAFEKTAVHPEGDEAEYDWHTRLDEVRSWVVRREKILIKDGKMRTFITNDKERNDLVGHVYDVTYGIVQPGEDTLVIMDDSIVRGTTLRTSILRILDRLGPKKIIMVSSAPQIRYPDCYGIDMSRLGDFVAFQAAIAVHDERGNTNFIQTLAARARLELEKPVEEQRNVVKDLYEGISEDDLTRKIAQIVAPAGIGAEVDIVYQTVEHLHQACPASRGDWYFTGDYPTPGGNRVANRSLVMFAEGNNERAY
jgi:amidophosphoribosyltransferase